MSQQEKSRYYKALQEAGVTFDRHYREYNTAELKAAWQKLQEGQAELEPEPQPEPQPQPQFDPEATAAAYANLAEEPPAPQVQQTPAPAPTAANPNELPGSRLNTKPEDEPIRVDEHGMVWYQEEVLKPAFPKPRGRRVLQYMDSGTKTETVQNGEYVETFEVSGDLPSRPAQVKITLPSYQVGIYKDPRFPFKIHTYNGNRGFDLFEVQNFYGGSELVPAEIKKVYVENVLCYDIRTAVRAIQSEYRQMQLAGKVK